ncbi:MAG: SDR family NAD(P)-dependent oxidoreductase, partial [Acetobacteraceae bacterium]|nr:SDR family NAD(P)-dependent oxidoreductase [Acetobacteraceae bacterium]
MRFRDRAVLVTGGGSGIGQQVCYAAAAEGALVAVGDLDLERAQDTAAEVRRR